MIRRRVEFFIMALVRERFAVWGCWFNKKTHMILIELGVKLATMQAV